MGSCLWKTFGKTREILWDLARGSDLCDFATTAVAGFPCRVQNSPYNTIPSSVRVLWRRKRLQCVFLFSLWRHEYPAWRCWCSGLTPSKNNELDKTPKMIYGNSNVKSIVPPKYCKLNGVAQYRRSVHSPYWDAACREGGCTCTALCRPPWLRHPQGLSFMCTGKSRGPLQGRRGGMVIPLASFCDI